MKICILGGSGRIGLLVLQQALTRGWTVTTLVRHPQKVSISHSHLLVVQGDATNSDDIIRAAHGCEVLVDAVSVGLFHHKPTRIYSQVTQAVIRSWGKLSTTQHIVMSSSGTHHGRDTLPWILRLGYEWLLGDVADDKENAEQLLQESQVPRTIIKAVKLISMNSSLYHTMDFADYVPSITDTISRSAVARVICDIAQQHHYINKKIVLKSGINES